MVSTQRREGRLAAGHERERSPKKQSENILGIHAPLRGRVPLLRDHLRQRAEALAAQRRDRLKMHEKQASGGDGLVQGDRKQVRRS